MKLYLLVLLAFIPLSNAAYSSDEETFCLLDSCYKKTRNTSIERSIQNTYFNLVKDIEGNTVPYVYFTEEMIEHAKNNLYKSFHKHFKWIDKDSLNYIVIGHPYSAVLLSKTNEDRYVLYYSHINNKFEIGYDSPKEFQQIDKSWVNSKTAPVVLI